MKPMSAHEFRASIKRLGFAESDAPNDLGLTAFASFIGASPRGVRKWADAGPPS